MNTETDQTELAADVNRDPVWNIAGDQAQQGIAKQGDEKIREDLRWLYHHARTRDWSLDETATRLGVDKTTVSRLYLGTYRNEQKGVLPPPAKMLSRLRIIRDQARTEVLHANKGRIVTPTSGLIHKVCQKVWNQRAMGFLVGPSHIGKTEALQWFRDENNHGTTVYLRMSAQSGQQELLRLFAEALKLSRDCPAYRLKPRILSALDESNFIIVDEVHQAMWTYQKGQSAKCMELLREIHDRTGAAMLLCGTLIVDHELRSGHDAALLKQIERRGIVKCRLPRALPAGDVQAICAAHGLADPALEEGAKWRALGTQSAHLAALSDIAHEHGIKRLILTLQDAHQLAKKAKRDVTWNDFTRAHNFYANLEIAEEV